MILSDQIGGGYGYGYGGDGYGGDGYGGDGEGDGHGFGGYLWQVGELVGGLI